MPAGGNLVILFSPHVGITPDGEFGKFGRDGQSTHDNACGAAVNASGAHPMASIDRTRYHRRNAVLPALIPGPCAFLNRAARS